MRSSTTSRPSGRSASIAAWRSSRPSKEVSARRSCYLARLRGRGAESGVRTGVVSKAVFLQPAIESAAAQAERFACMAHISAEAGERFLDQHALHIFDAHFVEFQRSFARGPQSQVARTNLRAFRHQHSAFDGMVEFANVPWPRMVEQDLQRDRLETFELLAVALRRLPQKVVRED